MIAFKRDFEAFLDEMNLVAVLLPFEYHKGSSSSFWLEKGGEKLPLEVLQKNELNGMTKYLCRSKENIDIGSPAWIIDEYGGKTDLQIGAVIRTDLFDQLYYYEGNDLGACYASEKTIFKLWAPTAVDVRIKLYNPKNHSYETFKLTRAPKGIWELTINKDLETFQYTYLLCINGEWRETVDPYVKAVTANGKKGVIVDLNKTKRLKPPLPKLEHPTDAIIYETHVRDFSNHPQSGISKKGTYLGVCETGTQTPNKELTGLSYVKELGVTHIEFLPMNDFEGVDELNPEKAYNWGYNPTHFNVPEGSYSSNPKDPYSRINELKEMITTIQENGLRVILDVVYNHVYIRENSPLELTVPGYYFRHNEHGMPSNGTGVGNDIASERLMVQKFIVDSVRFWLTEYQVDGFRFDLMGILDVDTMDKIVNTVHDLDPSAIIIGEGWDLNTPLSPERKANLNNQIKIPKIGQFNDWFRDTIKGSIFNLYDKGYALGNERYVEAAKQVLGGSVGVGNQQKGLFSEPTQSVNYVECHDNHTLWDKIKACNQEIDEVLCRKQHRLATAIVLLAQGIPFLHSGQEFFRTKEGVGNSYNSPDSINWLDWNRRETYKDNIEFIKNMIALRKAHKAFRFPTSDLIKKHMEFVPLVKPLIGYLLNDVSKYGEWEKIFVVFNPAPFKSVISLPEKGIWYLLADGEQVELQSSVTIESDSFGIEPWSFVVIAKK